MRDLQRYVGLVGLLAIVACSGGSAAPQPDGPPHLGILSGNNQTVAAAPAVVLPNQVVAQVVRLPNGTVALRVLDAMLPPKAYAQTAVNGIPGAVVCAVSPDLKHQLTPEVPCTNTDALGKAYFTYHADSVAGVAKSQVRGTVNGVTQVSDSVQATVTPGVPADVEPVFADAQGTPLGVVSIPVGGTIDLHHYIRLVTDKYGNMIAPSSIALVTPTGGLADTVSNFTPAYAVRATGGSGLPATADATGWVVNPGLATSGARASIYFFAGAKITGGITVQAQ